MNREYPNYIFSNEKFSVSLTLFFVTLGSYLFLKISPSHQVKKLDPKTHAHKSS